jgi:hypothetical protein
MIFKINILHRSMVPMLGVGFWLYAAGVIFAEPSTGSTSARSPKCQAEYEQCAANCDKTQIDVGNQIALCKQKCARDTDLYCSRTLTTNPNTGNLPKASVGALQNAPVNNPPPKTITPKVPPTGGMNRQ